MNDKEPAVICLKKDIERYGADCAIMLYNIRHWCNVNKANDRNYHDGMYWTFNSATAFAKIFPFWTPKKIRYILDRLVESKAIIVGNYNTSKLDRTLWYAVPDEDCEEHAEQNREIDFPKMGNGLPKNGTPIPDINTDINIPPTLRNTIPYGNTITSCYPQGQTNHISPVGDVLDGKRAANATDYAVPKVKTKPEDYGLVDFALQDIKVGDWERLLNWFEYHRREKNGKVIRPYVQSSFKQFANLLKELSGENWFYAMDAVEYAVNSCYRGFGDNMGFFYKLKSKEDYDEDLAFAKTLRSSPDLLFTKFQCLERYAPIVLDLAIELCDEQILQIHEAETRRKEAFEKLPDMDKAGGWFLDCFNEDMEKYKNDIAMVEKRKKWCEDKKISLQTKKII